MAAREEVLKMRVELDSAEAKRDAQALRQTLETPAQMRVSAPGGQPGTTGSAVSQARNSASGSNPAPRATAASHAASVPFSTASPLTATMAQRPRGADGRFLSDAAIHAATTSASAPFSMAMPSSGGTKLARIFDSV